ncbi:MAG: DUF4838 domain-containing protein [Verrucomicrobia bacterium]|nr:DUF4838 domain-containing protein [Verrucomicrobiota bacterium]
MTNVSRPLSGRNRWGLDRLLPGLLAAVVLPVTALGAAAKTCVLVKDGKPDCAVVLGEQATLVEKHAARELRDYLHKISGAEIPEASNRESVEGAVPILLGTPQSAKAVEALGLLEKVKNLSDEGFLIRIRKNEVAVFARQPMGVLYGVYTFLEDNLAIRWFFPGEKGEYCPKHSTIEINSLDEMQNPAFVCRTINTTATGISAKLTNTWDWMVRNKMQICWLCFSDNEKELTERGALYSCGGHALPYLVPQNKYFKEHPEYYALANGQRMPCWLGDYVRRHPEYQAPKGAGEIHQLCTSNPDVIDVCAAGIVKHFKEIDKPSFYKTGDSYYLGNNDGDGWCECEKCLALDDPEEQKNGMVSTRFYKFINAVAEKALKECPDKTMLGWGYQKFQSPPKGVKPDPRLVIEIAMHGRCYQHSYDDQNCPANMAKMKLLKGWLNFGNVAGVYEYYSCFADGSPNFFFGFPYLPTEDVVSRDIKQIWKMGARHWKAEFPPPDGNFGPPWNNWETKEAWLAQFATLYMAAKLTWNPLLDSERLKDDLYQKYYGSAVAPMKAYRDLLRKSWEIAKGHFIYGSKASIIGKCLVQPGREQELMKYLVLAEQSAGDDQALREKIAREKRYFAEVWQKALIGWNKLNSVEEIKVKEREGDITIDGVLQEPAWEKAVSTTGFIANSTGKLAKYQTFAKLLYDDEYLYIGVTALEPVPGKLLASQTRRDGPVWQDDDIEVFIDPAGTGENYYHFAVNPKGVIYDAKCVPGSYDTGFNADCKVACKTLADRWVLEMKIKAGSLNAKIMNGGIWKINIARSRHSDEGEASSWAVDGAFHQTASFRPVVFGSALIQNGGFETTVEVKNEADKKFYGCSDWKFGNDPILFPVHWALLDNHSGTLTLTHDGVHSGKNALKIEGGWTANYFSAATGDELHFDFWAKGEDDVALMLFQYTNTPEGGMQFIKTDVIATIPLSSEWTHYRFDHTIGAENVRKVALAFGVKTTLILDDVSAVKGAPPEKAAPQKP